MIRWFGPVNSGTASGGAGVATANADSTVPVNGLIQAVYIRYNDSPPAGTTDVTVSTKGNWSPTYNIVTISNTATDTLYYPRAAIRAQTGAAIYYDSGGTRAVYDRMFVSDIVNVKIEQANDGDSVDVWIGLVDT